MAGDFITINNVPLPVYLLDGSGVAPKVDPNTIALRVSERPIDVAALGEYSCTVSTGTMAAGAGAASIIAAFRWGDATRLALIRRVAIAMMSLGTGFAAGIALFQYSRCRAFTASDTGGGTATLSGHNQAKRTSFGASLVTDLRIATTAPLGAGTRVPDAQPAKVQRFGISAAINTVFLPTTNLWLPDMAQGEWPDVLATNEGFEILATVPATGTWQSDVSIDWDEVNAY